MEARADEARQVSPTGYAVIPSIGDARQALAIHGERENFRTVTIIFDSEEEARIFDNRVKGESSWKAVEKAIYSAHTEFEAVTHG